MAKHVVGKVSEVAPGERIIVELENRSIGVFNSGGEFFALRNRCPHQGAELCRGRLGGTTMPSQPGEFVWHREGKILRCPWHGWEFDIETGQSVFDPFKCRVRSYEVTLEPGKEDEDWPEVDTFPVSVERGNIVVTI